MNRAQSDGGGMMSHRGLLSLLVMLSIAALCHAGPLGPLPNVTSSDIGFKEGSCAVGDVVYLPGDELPGAGACERCTCERGGVRCERERCHPRPGCKAVHRPDHCCPTYQCECEQEGRVYGNGEKLVDPQDPCRVCYCQGGEVVCRRIACFVRDDCKPRLVPGRCCPEYDNCPLRGVSSIPGVTPSYSTIDDIESSPVPTAPKEIVKQEITIKEITPVSEIPVITEVKIKEIIPLPSIEVAEYSSSKSPLIVREATTEKVVATEPETLFKTEAPVIIEVHSSSPASSIAPEAPTKLSETSTEMKINNDSPPSKISLSTQDSINSEIYPSVMSSLATMGSPSIIQEVIHVASTMKSPIIEEEDQSLFEHNPAFPPIPDDLSQISHHEEESVPEQNADVEHVSVVHEEVNVPSASPSTEAVIISEPLTTTSPSIADTTSVPTSTTKLEKKVTETSTVIITTELSTTDVQSTASSEKSVKESPMLNLRSAIPTEILNVPSSVPEDITGELDEETATPTEAAPVTSMSTESVKVDEKYTEKSELPEDNTYQTSTISVNEAETTTPKSIETTVYMSSSQVPQQQSTSSIAKSDVATEITAQTELSSLPIETSDQNPHETSEVITKEQIISSTVVPAVEDLETTKISLPVDTEIITVSRAAPTENQSFENVETTEFVLTSFGSSESATDAVELIKISAEPEKSAAIIESPAPQRNKNNVLTELINLVGDVASMGDHTDAPDVARPTSISDSEELIPVNAGYKSKNSNWNLNSITEIPVKSKSQAPVNKQKVVEIEDDESESITDSPPPNDKVEPTTRRPIIDNVSDDIPQNKTEKKDIEIITKSYVPTINRRPTKVVMKKSNEPASEEMSATEYAPVSASSEVATESDIGLSSEAATIRPAAEGQAGAEAEAEAEAGERIAEAAPALEASEAQ